MDAAVTIMAMENRIFVIATRQRRPIPVMASPCEAIDLFKAGGEDQKSGTTPSKIIRFFVPARESSVNDTDQQQLFTRINPRKNPLNLR